MDPDISRWVLEFLLRSSVPDSLIAKTLTALPLSDADFRLKKTLLLRALHSLHSNASITETALEILELIEEIDRNDAVPVTDSMRRAFCAVAVECTVKYLAACPDDAAGNYFAAVRRIWRGRVARMESAGRRSVLFSDELVRWRDDLEDAVWDTRVCERLVELNSRTEAFNKVKVYLMEAWKGMGPSFLDSSLAEMAKGFRFDFGGESVRNHDEGLEVSVNVDDNDNENHDNDNDDNDNENHDNDDNGACPMENENQGKEDELEQRIGSSIDLNHQLPAEKEIQKGNLQSTQKHLALHTCPDSIGEFAYGGELKRKCDERLEGLTKQRMDFAGGDRSEPYDGGVCCMEDVPVSGEKQWKEQVEERVGTSVDGNQELDGCDLPAHGEKEIHKGNLQPTQKHLALHTCPDSIGEFAYGGELKRKCDEGLESLTKQRRGFAGGDWSEPHDGGVCCMEDVLVSGEKQRKEQVEERAGISVDGNQELGGCDLLAQGEKEIQKGNLQHRLKHTVLRRCHKGVKLSGTEELEPAKSWSKCDSVPSAEVKKVRESLKSSSLELQALVKDPLPDALQTSEVVRSKLAGKDINHEPCIENQNGDVDVPDPNVYQNGDVDLPDPNVCKSIVPFQPNDANLVKKPFFVHCSNHVRRPNLLERKVTARTCEGGLPPEGLPPSYAEACGFCGCGPAKRVMIFANSDEESLWDDSLDNLPQVAQPRKRKRKWTSWEEETLRAGVKMFGEGNWAAIRGFYSNIFENRSGVDLKDKWRNMMR